MVKHQLLGVLFSLALFGGFVSSFFLSSLSITTREGISIEKVNPLASERPGWWKKEVKLRIQKAEDCAVLETSQMLYCMSKELREISRLRGARFALDVIQPVAQRNPKIFKYNHELSHVIGGGATQFTENKKTKNLYTPQEGLNQSDFELIGRIGRAIADCDGWGAFGCYHGVIEVALAKLTVEKRTVVVKKACLEDPSVQSHRAFINQCLHWFGHGMAIFTNQSLTETLAVCTNLNPNFDSDDVQLCVSGVFHAGAQPGDVDAAFLHNISRVYSADDVFFPCREVDRRFKRQCYSQVPGRTGPELAKQFANCNSIPEKDPVLLSNYVHWCYNSLANNVLVSAEFDGPKTIAKCQQYALPAYRKYCYEGAVRYSILRDPLLNNPVPFQMCELAEPEAKPLCYTGLGAANAENYFSREILTKFCDNLKEKEYYNNCMMLETPDDFGKLL